jgi:hypothetical protein
MKEKYALKVIDDLMDVGVKAFDFSGGGEPLMMESMPKLWDHVKQRGGYFGLITNGTLLYQHISNQLLEQATYVRISMEASDALSYQEYKGVNLKHWENMIENLCYIANQKHKTNSKCQISLKFAVGKTLKGKEHFYNGIQWGHNLMVDSVQFKALRHFPEELSFHEKIEQQGIIDNLYALNNYIPKVNVRSWILPFPDEKIPQCWLNPLHVAVDHQGNCYICCYYYYRKSRHYIGNMVEDKFVDFWGTSNHQEKVNNIDPNECRQVDCKFYHHHVIVNECFQNGRENFL